MSRIRYAPTLGICVVIASCSYEMLQSNETQNMMNLEMKTALASNENWTSLLEGAISINGTAAERYLCRERAILRDAAQSAGVLFQPHFAFPALKGKYTRPAVVFAFRGEGGETVAIQARSLTKKMIYSSPGIGQGVFVGSSGALDGDAPVLLCEAPIDALSLESAGFPAIAIIGTAPWLIERLRHRTVYNCHDNDPGGGGDQAAELIERVLKRKCPRLIPDCKDWNEQLVKQGVALMSKWLDGELQLDLSNREPNG